MVTIGGPYKGSVRGSISSRLLVDMRHHSLGVGAGELNEGLERAAEAGVVGGGGHCPQHTEQVAHTLPPVGRGAVRVEGNAACPQLRLPIAPVTPSFHFDSSLFDSIRFDWIGFCFDFVYIYIFIILTMTELGKEAPPNTE